MNKAATSQSSGTPDPSDQNFAHGKKRLDQALVDLGLCASRVRAKRDIMAGQVTFNDRVAAKPSDTIKPQDRVALVEGEKFVSRGGLKLEHALNHFRLDVTGNTVVDLGASTGGFTDCVLQRGAGKGFSVDVGPGPPAWKIRPEPRIMVMEKKNAPELTPPKKPPPLSPPAPVGVN